MTATYYDRHTSYLADGTPAFATDADRSNESAAADAVGDAWSCTLHHFGAFSAIDYYAVRRHNIVGVVEIKARSHASDTHDSVFLNVRKWLALQLAANGLGVPAIYVVSFTDRLMWTNVATIDASRVRVGGCTRRVKATSDVEPIIDVPIGGMDAL